MGILDNVFESVGKTINDASQSVVNKSKEFSDISKLNSLINEEQRKIEGLYSLIGKKYFELHPDSTEEGIGEMVSSIKASLAQLDTYRENLQILKGVRVCPHCGAEIALNAMFCSSCGNKLEPIVVQNQSVCSNCGAQLAPGAKFCGNCSHPVGVPNQPQINVAENAEFNRVANETEQTEEIKEAVNETVQENVENQGENE